MKNKKIFVISGLMTAFCLSFSAAILAGFAKTSQAYAETVYATEHMEMQKNQFEVGEPINVKTMNSVSTDVVYLVKSGWENDTSGGNGAGKNIYLRYNYPNYSGNDISLRGYATGVGDSVYFDMLSASLGRIGFDPLVSSYLIPAGDYEMLFVPNDGWETGYTEKLSFSVVESAVNNPIQYHITTEKTVYSLGETVTVSITGDDLGSTDWIGHAKVNEYYSSGYAYCQGNSSYQFTPTEAGQYRVAFIRNDASFYKYSEALVVTVLPTSTDHLQISKAGFEVGEPIKVTPTEQNVGGYDWIGITNPAYPDQSSITWKYISSGVGSGDGQGAGSGVEIDLVNDASVTFTSQVPLAAGIYTVIFVPNDGGFKNATETLEFYVLDVDSNVSAVRTFVANYMHMSESTVNQCLSYYSDAKTAYSSLTNVQKVLFKTNSQFADAYARLSAWATANGDEFDSNNQLVKVSARNIISEVTTEGSVSIAIVVAIVGIATLAIVLKRKHN